VTPIEGAAGMSWVKLDDGFTDHPKIAHVGAIGAWLQLQALCYCNRNLTDGFVPYSIAQSFLARGVVRTDDRGVLWTLSEHSGHQGLDLADVDWPGELVKAGMWEVVAGGYRIHNYDHYQPRKIEVLAERRKHADRQRNYLRRKADAVTDGVTDAAPVPVPVTERTGSLSVRARAPRATQWPENFTLTLDRAEVARALRVDAAAEWAKFKDHALKDGATHKNWDAAWRYWCRRAPEFLRRRVP
jgi:hypothetical protein